MERGGSRGGEIGERKRSGEEGRKGGVRQRGERRGRGRGRGGCGVDVAYEIRIIWRGRKDPNSGFVYVRRAVFQTIFSNGEQMVYGRISPCALNLLCRHLHWEVSNPSAFSPHVSLELNATQSTNHPIPSLYHPPPPTPNHNVDSNARTCGHIPVSISQKS